MTPTQADREAFLSIHPDPESIQADVSAGAYDQAYVMKRLVAFRLAAEAAAFEKAAGVVEEHQASRLAAKHNALERGQKAEARDHESMAMEAGHILVSIQTAIRKLAGEKHD